VENGVSRTGGRKRRRKGINRNSERPMQNEKSDRER
jgi:hypothetical protein